MRRLWERKNHRIYLRYGIYLLLIVFAVLSFSYDSQIVKSVSEMRTAPLTLAMEWISLLGNGWIVFFIGCALFFAVGHKRRWLIPYWLSLFVSLGICALLKYSILRTRPDLAIAGLLDSSPSFPSGHTTAVFSVVPVLINKFGKVWYLWLIFAVLVGFSRIYLSMHYLSDVLFGAFLGLAVGNFFIWLEERTKLGDALQRRLQIRNTFKHR